MRHPNIVSFCGLCPLPPSILTGKHALVKHVPVKHAAGLLGMPWSVAVLYGSRQSPGAPAGACLCSWGQCLILKLQAHCNSLSATLPHSLIVPYPRAEFCHKGSLYDVLSGGAKEAEKAAELTWQLRVGMAMDAARGEPLAGSCCWHEMAAWHWQLSWVPACPPTRLPVCLPRR